MSHLIRIYTVCHSVIDIGLNPLFATMDVSRFKAGRVHFRNLGVKVLNMNCLFQLHDSIVCYTYGAPNNLGNQTLCHIETEKVKISMPLHQCSRSRHICSKNFWLYQCLACWVKLSADNILKLFFFRKWGFDISCKLSPKETICMKCQTQFYREKK